MSIETLNDAIAWLEQAFDDLGIRRSYGGAIAYNFHGPPRYTQDIDVLVLVPDTRIPGLVDRLAASGARQASHPPKPLELRAFLADLRSASHMAAVWLDKVKVEFFVPWHPFHHRVLERSTERVLDSLPIRIHAAEDLIVFKKIFDRPKDIQDIKAMLMARRGLLDLERLRSDARQFLEEASWQELDAMIRTYGGG